MPTDPKGVLERAERYGHAVESFRVAAIRLLDDIYAKGLSRKPEWLGDEGREQQMAQRLGEVRQAGAACSDLAYAVAADAIGLSHPPIDTAPMFSLFEKWEWRKLATADLADLVAHSNWFGFMHVAVRDGCREAIKTARLVEHHARIALAAWDRKKGLSISTASEPQPVRGGPHRTTGQDWHSERVAEEVDIGKVALTANDPTRQKDGPQPPYRFVWDGKSERVERRPWQLLDYLWPRRDKPVRAETAVDAVWGKDSGPDDTPLPDGDAVKSAVKKANAAINKTACPYRITRSGDFITLESK